jgi:glycosyltransferase involved in cell wall biosynthesis
MDRDMPPRVTYWTGIWDPSREAISKDVETLRRRTGMGDLTISFSSGQRSSLLVRDRVIRLSARRWVALRAIASTLERLGDVTHVIGGLNSWHLLRSVGRRPVIFTVALSGPPLERRLCDKVSIFAAQSERLGDAIVQMGVPRARVRVVYPGVDLERFVPAPPPTDTPFRLLFASTPADPAEFDARGIPLLIEIARRHPDVELILLWRRWGDARAARRALQALAPPHNLRIEDEVADVVTAYRNVHATICCYEADFGKSCPNSIVESLACGRPVIVTDTCGIAHLIDDHSAGVAVPRTIEAIGAAIGQLRAGYPSWSQRARTLAERHFGIEPFVQTYGNLYAELA